MKIGNFTSNFRPSTIKQMTEVEAAVAGSMIDTDGCIRRIRNKKGSKMAWEVQFTAQTLPALAYDLLEITGGGKVCMHIHKGKEVYSWYIQRLFSIIDLAIQIAPWSYKASDALQKLESAITTIYIYDDSMITSFALEEIFRQEWVMFDSSHIPQPANYP